MISFIFFDILFLLNERSATHAVIYARGNQPWIARDPGGVACQAPPTTHPKKHDLYTTHFWCGPPNTYITCAHFCKPFNSISRPLLFFYLRTTLQMLASGLHSFSLPLHRATCAALPSLCLLAFFVASSTALRVLLNILVEFFFENYSEGHSTLHALQCSQFDQHGFGR